MNTEYITIHEVADSIYSHPLMRDLPFDKIVYDTIELMQITGSPTLFDTKEEVLEVENWRAALPCDFYEVIQINQEVGEHSFRVFKESTDTFSLEGSGHGADLTYKIKGRVLYTSIKKGRVRISYTAIKLDEDGFPLIINNASYIRALKSYIKLNWFTILFDSGQIQGQVLENAQRDYYSNIAQAQNSLIMPDLAQMENLAIIMNDAMSRQREYFNNFRDINKSHQLRKH